MSNGNQHTQVSATKEQHGSAGLGLSAKAKVEVVTAVTNPEGVEQLAPGSVPSELIGQRAYEKFVARGYVHGHDCEDWCAAETELIAEGKGQKA